MLQHSGLSNVFWAEAINTAAYVLNRAPTSAVKDKTLQEAWYGKKPTVQHFRVFGCNAYAHVPDEKRTKLDPKSIKCIFLGYYKGTKCYRLFNPKTKTIVKSRDVKFVETTENKDSEGTIEISNETLEPSIKVEVDSNSDDCIYESESETKEVIGDVVKDLTIQPPLSLQEIRSTAREVSQPKTITKIVLPPPPPMITRSRARELARTETSSYVSEPSTDVIPSVCMAHAFHTSIDEPLTVTEAMERDDSWKDWKEAMESEFQSLIDNKTWELVPLPKGHKSIGCKWIFKIQYSSDGSVERIRLDSWHWDTYRKKV